MDFQDMKQLALLLVTVQLLGIVVLLVGLSSLLFCKEREGHNHGKDRWVLVFAVVGVALSSLFLAYKYRIFKLLFSHVNASPSVNDFRPTDFLQALAWSDA